MKVHVPADNSGSIARLAAQLDRLERDVEALGTMRADVGHQGEALRQLGDVIRRQAAKSGTDEEPSEPRPEWMTVDDPAAAIVWLSELDAWVRRVWIRYQPITACWPWHPPVVAELLACRSVWVSAIDPEAGSVPMATWHDRWRPGVQSRIGKALTGCDRADVHIDGITRWQSDPARLDELAHWWATDRSGVAPGLTSSLEMSR